MTSRVHHSFAGMRRLMLLSQHGVFLFVEGRDLDPDVYSRICGAVCKEARRDYEIVIADRIAGGGGGKNILTHFFEYLRDSGSLIDRSQTPAKIAMFYLDKDADEFFRKLRSSDHIVYTKHYDIESHLFAEGDLVSSIATAGSVDIELVRAQLPDPARWRSQAALQWREWVALCLLARKLMLRGQASYSAYTSALNNPADAPSDPAILAAHLAQMQAHCRLTPAEFHRKVASAYRLVDAVYARTQQYLLFKGKWYSVFAILLLERLSRGLYNRHGAAERLVGSLIASTDFSGRWADFCREPLRKVLAAAQ